MQPEGGELHYNPTTGTISDNLDVDYSNVNSDFNLEVADAAEAAISSMVDVREVPEEWIEERELDHNDDDEHSEHQNIDVIGPLGLPEHHPSPEASDSEGEDNEEQVQQLEQNCGLAFTAKLFNLSNWANVILALGLCSFCAFILANVGADFLVIAAFVLTICLFCTATLFGPTCKRNLVFQGEIQLFLKYLLLACFIVCTTVL